MINNAKGKNGTSQRRDGGEENMRKCESGTHRVCSESSYYHDLKSRFGYHDKLTMTKKKSAQMFVSPEFLNELS